MSDSLLQSIHRDAIATLRALTATIRGLVLRGDSLQSISDKSDDLLMSAIVFEERAQRAHQAILAENRSRLALSRMVILRCCFCLLVLSSLTFFYFSA